MPSIEEFLNPANPLGFVAGFAVIWVFVGVLISRIGGWNQLARVYGSESDYGGERWRYQSAGMRYST